MNKYLRSSIFETLKDDTQQANYIYQKILSAKKEIQQQETALKNYENAMTEAQKEFGFIFKANDIETDPRGAFEKCIQRYELKDPKAKDDEYGETTFDYTRR